MEILPIFFYWHNGYFFALYAYAFAVFFVESIICVRKPKLSMLLWTWKYGFVIMITRTKGKK